MAREQNIRNLKTEKIGLTILRDLEPRFMVPTSEQKRKLYRICEIDYGRYSKSIDGIILKVATFDQIKSHEDFLFVEVKTTASKTVKELPFGVFFGFTENEESLFRSEANYRLCIVHTGMKSHYMLTFEEYESLIQSKRIQYQISFRSSR